MRSGYHRMTPDHVVAAAMDEFGELVRGECPCGAAFEILADGPPPGRYRNELNGVVHIPVSCPSCGYITYAPPPDPESVHAYYENLRAGETDKETYKYYSTGYGTPHVEKRAAALVARIRACMAPSGNRSREAMRIFDLGCGDGHLVHALNAIGHDAWGADPGGEQIAFGRSRGNERIACGDAVEELGRLSRDRPFDAVILFHVLEHVPEPARFLKRIKEATGPDAGLFIAVPNAWYLRLRFAPLIEFRWHGFPNHLHFFSPPALVALLDANEWTPLDVGGGSHNDPDPEGLARVIFGKPLDALPALDEFVGGLERNLASCDFWVMSRAREARGFLAAKDIVENVRSGRMNATS